MAKKDIRFIESELMYVANKRVLTYFHQPTNSQRTIMHYSLLSDAMTEDVTYGINVRNEYIYENLNEGLIMSYDINRSAAYLKEKFPNISNIRSLQFNPYKTFRPAYYKPKNNDFVSIDLGTNFSNFREISNHVETLLGWFTSEVFIHEKVKTGFIPREFHNLNGDFICPQLNNTILEDYLAKVNILSFSLIIQAKFGERHKTNENEVFYHITEKDNLKKISTQGLCPISYGSLPERVYLNKSIPEQINLKNMVALKVDVQELNLYCNNQWDTTVYTYDTIHPSKIRVT